MITTNHIQAEKSVLANLLGFDERFDEVSDVISVDDFEATRHKHIYQAVTDLVERNQPSDIVMVADLMTERGQIGDDVASGQCPNSYLSEIAMMPTASSKSLRSHADLIVSNARRRKSLTALKRAVQKLEDADSATDDVNNDLVSELTGLEQREEVQEVFSVDAMINGLVERMQAARDGIKSYIETGFFELDSYIQASRGDLIVVAGRPSMGKSLAVMNMQAHIAKSCEGQSVFFSLEMNEARLIERLAASEASAPIKSIKNNSMSEDEWARFMRFTSEREKMRLTVIHRSQMTVAQMRGHLNRIKREKGSVSAIGVDYLQIMGGIDGNDRVNAIGDVTRTLKALGNEFDCPVFLLSQLNRSVEQRPNKRPLMSDLRDSGAIEQDADTIIMLYRDDYYKQKDGNAELDGVAEFIVNKCRNGETGTVRLGFEGHMGRFSNLIPQMGGYDDE